MTDVLSVVMNTRDYCIPEVDLETAQNAGLPCIAVLWGFRDKEFLIEKGAEYFAEKPDDVERIISRINDSRIK